MAPFVSRQRKHKKRQRAGRDDGGESGANSNTLEILPPSTKGKEDKETALKDALRAEQPKMSSRKQKRLDKYIVGEAGEEMEFHADH